MNSIDSETLIQEIHIAFDKVPKPEQVTLRVARGIDDYLPQSELDNLRKGDTDERWQDITDAELEEYGDVHPFLCAVGLRYYLPSFMIWSIRHHSSSDLPIPQYTLYSLWLYPETLELLNKPQRQVIARFVKFAANCMDQFDAEAAQKLYTDYWKEFDLDNRS